MTFYYFSLDITPLDYFYYASHYPTFFVLFRYQIRHFFSNSNAKYYLGDVT